jgi:ferredoxin-NADP reductase
MDKQIVKILKAEFINHNVKQFKLQKPAGFTFIPGQAADVSINLPGWENNLHPFTFTSLNEWDYLEFTIKIYPERKGVTNMLGQLNAGAELIINDVFGVINYKGPGVFIAGGAGITPFIAIFRDLHKRGKLAGNKLIFSNKTSADIILKDELTAMLEQDFINVLTREHSIGFTGRRIDRNFLIDHISDFGQYFYVCGPDEFVEHISNHLTDLGAKADTLVIEK